MLNCTKCCKVKDECEFRVRKSLKSGYNSWCKECQRDDNKKRYIPKEKNTKEVVIKSKKEIAFSAKKRMLKNRYGITYEEYETMYLEQDKKCKICKNERELGGTKGLYVDHCHKTNKVRGLLCPSCNMAIGVLKENEEFFMNAIYYLKENLPRDNTIS